MSTVISLAQALAGRVKQRRLELGWRQADFASRAGVDLATYKRFEHAGRITLDRLIGVLGALGLADEINLLVADAPAPAGANPRLPRRRQRGVRQSRPAVDIKPDAATTNPEPAAVPPSGAVSTPTTPPVAPAAPEPKEDPAGGASSSWDPAPHRDALRMLVGVIVNNALTNHTSSTAVQNVMRARRLDEGGRRGFVAFLEGELRRLNPENLPEYGLGLAAFERWAKTWKPELGILHALE